MEKGLGGAAGGHWLRLRGKGHTAPRRRLLPPPPGWRSLSGSNRRGGRSGQSQRRQSPGRDSQQLWSGPQICSCLLPGRPARPAPPAPRPLPPAGPPLRLPATRGDTEARLGGDVSGRPEPSPDCVWRLGRSQTSRSAGPGAPIRATARARSESASLALALPLARPQISPPRKSSSDCFGIQRGASD